MLLWECTYVFVQPWVQAGIQRVVRSIAQQTQAHSQPGPHNSVLVAISDDGCFVPNNLTPAKQGPVSHQISRAFAWLLRARAAVERKIQQRPTSGVAKSYVSHKCIGIPLCWGASLFLAFLRVLGADPYTTRAKPFEPQRGDILVLLDSSWHDPRFFRQVRKLKDQGVHVVSVVYDLIPIAQAEYCDKNLTPVFSGWLDEMIAVADGFVCISQSTCQEVRAEVARRVGEDIATSKTYRSFQLGSELDLARGQRKPSEMLKNCFAGPELVFLVVGTIEPRKNHATILNAFEQHWSQGGTSQLCIMGRSGWMCDDVLHRLRSSAQLNRKLFTFHDAGDDDLEFAYHNADVLIMASFVEGFGLPLVEALQRGLPVIASDIPVFREVAGDFAEYFNPHNAAALTKIVEDFAATRRLPNARAVTEWRGVTWRESAQQLTAAVLDCVENSRSAQEKTRCA